MSIIYCIEDDESIRELISYAVKSSGIDIKSFENAAEFEIGMKEQKPDMVLLDIMLPDKDGIQILKDLRSDISTMKIPVIIITAKNLESDKIRGFDLGADDYVTKPFSVLELISRIKAVLRRSGDAAPSIIKYNGITIDNAKRLVLADGKNISLTYKEFELLYNLLNEKGNAVKREDLLNKIWGYEYEGETRTLDVHIGSLRHKLGDRGKIIETVRNVGYKIS